MVGNPGAIVPQRPTRPNPAPQVGYPLGRALVNHSMGRDVTAGHVGLPLSGIEADMAKETQAALDKVEKEMHAVGQEP